ncbi:hypothetical protein [Pseudonocardia sp.]|uniref:hypothetical protein n=1 Tax=Pseudonocardia sp. TaxID=60912 RepID=UPI003D0E5882
MTAEVWLAADRADRVAEDDDREIRDEFEFDGADRVTREERVDVRDRSTAHATEHTDPVERRRVPTLDETAESVARAQVALVEIEQRHLADGERVVRDSEDVARAEELARWASREETTTFEDAGPVLER